MCGNNRGFESPLPFHFVDTDNSQDHVAAGFQVVPFPPGRARAGWHDAERQAPIHQLRDCNDDVKKQT